jgi:dTDP-4-amino-4,6-dideoxygalactose transaminase
MLELQGAMGRVQLQKMGLWTAARNSNAERIWNVCRRHKVVRVPVFRCNKKRCAVDCAKASGCVHARYKCYVYVQPEFLNEGWDRDRILSELIEQGVACYQGACPEIYMEECFEKTNQQPPNRLPVARELGETSLMFAVHPTLTDGEIEKTCAALEDVLHRASSQ